VPEAPGAGAPSSGPPPPVVQLQAVSFWYPGARDSQPALAELNLSLCAGELAVVCGPSGSGKSTLLRLCIGLVPQFSGGRLAGEISVVGRDPAEVAPRHMAAAGVGLLFQNPVEGFVAERVFDEVAFGPENLGLPAIEVAQRVAAALASVGLTSFDRRRLRELSSGEQQRVALAGVLALRPRLLVLDEPTAHLDESAAETVLGLVSDLRAELGLTVLLAEHRLGIAARLASRLLVLEAGRLVADGLPRVVLGDASLPGRGVPVPRATQAALAVGLAPPLPVNASELAPRLKVRQSAPVDDARPFTPLRQPTLLFEGVCFTYPGAARRAVNDVSLCVSAGEVVALVGPSGAGKSTLARLALGLLRPDRGRVVLAGASTRTTRFSTLAGLGGLVLQNPLHQLLTERVEDELWLGVRDLSPNEARQRVDTLLATLDLEPLRRRHPLLLSEGQRRRVALASVLVREPRVLVLDEPTLGQDERQRAALVDLVRHLAGQARSLLVITHDREFTNDACDRVLLLEAGRLRADVPVEQPEQLAAAGVPLADIPATGLLFGRTGHPLRLRSAADLARVCT
jgi:energy-coupling factor transport system ATP-binding protein